MGAIEGRGGGGPANASAFSAPWRSLRLFCPAPAAPPAASRRIWLRPATVRDFPVMTAQRSTFALVLVLGTLVVACAQNTGSTQVVALVTHSSPGGGSDVFLREMAPHLTRIMGDTFIVENMQGGSGAKAMATLAKAKPDGRMFYATTPTFVYTSLMSRPAATYTDLEPLVNMFFDPEVLYTAVDSRFKTLRDVIEHARSGGGKWGAANPASLERQVMEQMKQKA